MWWQTLLEHIGSFMFGVVVGLMASSRYRIVARKNGNGDA